MSPTDWGRGVGTTPERGTLHGDVLDAVGNTPLVRLSRLFPVGPAVYGKLESLNPSGSMKDRSARLMLERAMASGRLRPGGTVLESSSGNMGIALAQACALLDLSLVCVVDTRITPMNLAILRALGAQVDVVCDPEPETGDLLVARLARVAVLERELPGSLWINQYANLDAPDAYTAALHEVLGSLEEPPDVILCPVSTCGLLRGTRQYLSTNGLATRLVAVDAAGSILFGGTRQPRLLTGHGAGVLPPLFSPDLADQVVHVADIDAVRGCHDLARQEGILAGSSSGATLAAARDIVRGLRGDSVCVLFLADRGERYLDTVFSPQWLVDTFGQDAARNVLAPEER